jgi:hypothetical protein
MIKDFTLNLEPYQARRQDISTIDFLCLL